MTKLNSVAAMLVAGLVFQPAHAAAQQPRNVVLFVPDGLRALLVTPETAPTMAAVRDQGVNFKSPHSLFPTFTMANSSGLSTGHFLGDTGVFSNTLFTGYPPPPGTTVTPFIENDAVLGTIDAHFGGSFISEDSVIAAARRQGLSTAAIGKLGPALLFDHTERSGAATIIFDDSTGGDHGIPLSPEIKDALTAVGLPLKAPTRGANGNRGDANKPGTLVANVEQQTYFAAVAAKVVLPLFKARNKPFVLVFWSRDPDGSQHNTGDSLNTITPGINGPTSMAGIKNADNNLAQLRHALDELGLAGSTNIMISSDHGFSTISKESKTSPSAKTSYADTPKDFLPMGFLAIDLAKALNLPLFDPNNKNAAVAVDAHPKAGNGVLGKDPAKPDLVVATNGGSDLIYIPGNERKLADRTIKALLEQDYVSGIFVNDDFGRFPGTLPMSQLGLIGKAVTPHPSILVNFRSWSSGCEEPTNCSVQVADTVLRQGQGMHGSFSRGDTLNFTAAIGPDFKSGYVDAIPVSNADVGATAAKVMGLMQKPKGTLIGRVMTEAMPNGATPQAYAGTVKSKPSANGLRTVLNFQRVGAQRYFDTAGFPGRTLGLEEESKKTARK